MKTKVVPHEVMGMANFNKNLFVGVGGLEAINLSHFIGAVVRHCLFHSLPRTLPLSLSFLIFDFMHFAMVGLAESTEWRI